MVVPINRQNVHKVRAVFVCVDKFNFKGEIFHICHIWDVKGVRIIHFFLSFLVLCTCVLYKYTYDGVSLVTISTVFFFSVKNC